jgi:hypothetical protein
MNDYARTFTILGIALHFHEDIYLKKQVFLRLLVVGVLNQYPRLSKTGGAREQLSCDAYYQKASLTPAYCL